MPSNPNYAELLARIPIAVSPPVADVDDLDSDSNTDNYLLAAWVSLIEDWPGTTPVNLMTLTFDIESGASGTTAINIDATSSAANFTFDGQDHTINIDGTSTVTIPSTASATQHVYVSSSTRSADGTQETVTISYNNEDSTVTGLGLRIHYDETKLSLVSVTDVLETALFIRPEAFSGQARQVINQLLSGRVYTTLTFEELSLFDYAARGYIADTPTADRNSYVGDYIPLN